MTNATPEEIHENRWRILAVLCLSLVIIVAGNASLNVALPTLVTELNATQTQLQWIVDAYALVFAGLLLPAGALGDRYGRKGALQIGLAVFALGAVLATMSTSAVQVIFFRALMGVGAAFVMPSTLSILTGVFKAGERAKAIAIWAAFAGAGGAIGMVASGLLLKFFWWGSVFLVNLPLVALAAVVGAVLLPTSRDSQKRPLDPVGAVLSILGLGGVLFGIIEGPAQGWSSTLVIAGFTIGVLGLGLFTWWESRTAYPMLDLNWFKDRRFSVGAFTIALTFFAFFGMFFLATQYLQFALGYTPLVAGLASLPMTAAMINSAPRSAGLVERFGHGPVVGTGLGIVAVGFLWMSSFTVTTPYISIAIALILLGTGGGAVMAPSTGAIMSALPQDKAGVGSAVNDATREVGGAIGIAVLGSIMASLYRTNLASVLDTLGAVPDQVREVAQSSVGAALQIAANAPDPVAASLAIRTAFTDAVATSFLIAAVVTALNAVLVWRLSPKGDLHAETDEEPLLVPTAAPAATATTTL
ncbi:MAG: EmrB/QacA subfamily drug resistance transporter [Glaciecola sp.]|jgi:EmrB/QacA subfamily drug resistance transporter